MLTFEKGAALITGGGSGIGRATALMLAKAGTQVAVADIDPVAIQQTVSDIEGLGGAALAVPIDVQDKQSVDDAFEQVEAWHDGITILVNSAGILRMDTFEDFDVETWNQVFNVNVTGSFLCGQRAAANMKKVGYGRIINLSSISGTRAGVGRTAYGTSKAAISGLTRQMALELGRHGITANAVAPGATTTPMTNEAYTEETKALLLPMIPTGFIATPEDIANAIVFLASQQARYINGHTLPVDGGYLASGMLQTGSISLN
ncbi:NAD(P)-dependent dehydrogenase, short-chain alcohol dehydrogenase family [Sulfitobacter brevis]|uniref:NAD(P)-dependent dehydrogenase, short-chain alcohol dehydrogenase family n=1 Tax=Sulfitobacter brevis TaxID=74348 RepID=A0A1I2GHN1_9RHOB|nr:SDR family oxidoreductase [Sulfitobacter brevis]SFF16500.1 NAD(P)-dependent dehydrogenase, short-chain alcohol dehydrogenase family [Sulfitobacter brevis]